MAAPEVILIDTCVVIWLAGDPGSLSKAASAAITEARKSGGVAIADITLYELAWLARNGRIAITGSVEAFLARVETLFIVQPVTASVAQIAVDLPASYPRDPVDRLIGATALSLGMPLVTRDKLIRKSKALPVIW